MKQPVVFTSWDIAIDRLNEGFCLLFSEKYSFTMRNDLFTACLRQPVFGLEFQLFGLKALPHFRMYARTEEAKQASSYLNYIDFRNHILKKNLHQFNNILDLFIRNLDDLTVQKSTNYPQKGVSIHVDHKTILIFHKFLHVSYTILQLLYALFVIFI